MLTSKSTFIMGGLVKAQQQLSFLCALSDLCGENFNLLLLTNIYLLATAFCS